MLARCDHIIQIPTRFSLNLAVAGALVLYDRLQMLERFAPRPLMAGGTLEASEPPPAFVRPYGCAKTKNAHKINKRGLRFRAYFAILET